MKLISAFEHGWLSIGNEGDLTAVEADALAAAESYLPKNCLEWSRNKVKFRQFCGVLQIQQCLQIEILPKVYPHQTHEQQRKTLIEMLAISGDIDELSVQQASLGTNSNRLLDVFIHHFLELLEVQLRQGLLRDYRDIDDTLSLVRGRINMTRQLRENLLKPQLLACKFNELIDDIPVNRLLHSALLRISGLTNSPVLLQKIHNMRIRFSDIGILHKSDKPPCIEDLNRMQRRYSSVVNLARLFINGQYLEVRTGQQQVFSLLFDMNKLFERFVATKLRPVARGLGLGLIEQGPRKYLGNDTNGKERLFMRPDISFIDTQKRPRVILDAKWKLLDSGDPIATLSSADLYQLSTYASVYRCDRVILVYPEQDGFRGEAKMTLSLERPVGLAVLAMPLVAGRYYVPESLLCRLGDT